MITIYTDGSSKGNPGPGGWGAIIIRNDDKSEIRSTKSEIREMGGKEKKTTNNRMEMKAAIEGLKSLPAGGAERNEVEIHTDSEYLMKGATFWIHGWQKNGWKTKDKKQVLNQDLWQELIFLLTIYKVDWKKVLGHSGDKFNERCDEIAISFADNKKTILYDGSKKNYKI